MELVYQYDYNGYYIGETIAYHGLPHNCTKVKPKQQKEYIPQWVNNSWKQIEDHRQQKDDKDCIIKNTGTPYWMPEDTWETPPRYMTKPGPLPENALLTQPEQDPAEKLFERKKLKLMEIYSKHDTTLIEILLSGTSMDSIEVRALLSQQRATFEQQVQEATTVEEVDAIQVVYTL